MMDNIKKWVQYVLLPLTIVFGIFLYLWEQLRVARGQLGMAKAEQELEKAEEHFNEVKKDADAKTDAFNKHYDDYIKRNKPS